MVQWVSHGPCPGGIFNSCAMAALRSGHSHEDIDQCFGRLASWMQKKPYALEPSDFVPLINDFLKESDFPLSPTEWPSKSTECGIGFSEQNIPIKFASSLCICSKNIYRQPFSWFLRIYRTGKLHLQK